jgi:hypothetical protein
MWNTRGEGNAYSFLVRKLEGGREFGTLRHRWEGNIRINLQEVGREGVD